MQCHVRQDSTHICFFLHHVLNACAQIKQRVRNISYYPGKLGGLEQSRQGKSKNTKIISLPPDVINDCHNNCPRAACGQWDSLLLQRVTFYPWAKASQLEPFKHAQCDDSPQRWLIKHATQFFILGNDCQPRIRRRDIMACAALFMVVSNTDFPIFETYFPGFTTQVPTLLQHHKSLEHTVFQLICSYCLCSVT